MADLHPDDPDRENTPDPPDPPSIRELPAEAVLDLIETSPTEVRRELLTTLVGQYFSGPLPPPELLRQYDEIVPGFAQTIVDQFVAQGDHRRELEKTVIFSDVTRANWGLIAGFTLALIGVVGSIYIMSTGKTTAGLTAFIVSLAPLVVAFLEATRRRRKERLEKAIQVPEE